MAVEASTGSKAGTIPKSRGAVAMAVEVLAESGAGIIPKSRGALAIAVEASVEGRVAIIPKSTLPIGPLISCMAGGATLNSSSIGRSKGGMFD